MQVKSKGISASSAVVFGFGAQGRAQAINLRAGGWDVAVHLRRRSPRSQQAQGEGFAVIEDPAEAARSADFAVLLIPDSEQPEFYRDWLEPNLRPGTALVFAHGFNVHYGRIAPRRDIDCVLAAPLAHGDLLRDRFAQGLGVPCVVAVSQDATGKARERARAYARAVCGAGPFIESTFSEETETDLFAEQAVLCGGVPELIRASFETLTAAGYNEQIAYVSCLRELRAIVDLMLDGAIAGMLGRISDTARYGAVTRGPRIIGAGVRAELEKILEEIRSGRFAQEMAEEKRREFEGLAKRLAELAAHPIETAHRAHVTKEGTLYFADCNANEPRQGR